MFLKEDGRGGALLGIWWRREYGWKCVKERWGRRDGRRRSGRNEAKIRRGRGGRGRWWRRWRPSHEWVMKSKSDKANFYLWGGAQTELSQKERDSNLARNIIASELRKDIWMDTFTRLSFIWAKLTLPFYNSVKSAPTYAIFNMERLDWHYWVVMTQGIDTCRPKRAKFKFIFWANGRQRQRKQSRQSLQDCPYEGWRYREGATWYFSSVKQVQEDAFGLDKILHRKAI